MKRPRQPLSSLLHAPAEFIDAATAEEAGELIDHLARVVTLHEARLALNTTDGRRPSLGYVEGLPAHLYFEGDSLEKLVASFFRAVDHYRRVLKERGEYPECAP